MMKARLLLIEDDPGTGAALQKVLRGEGYDVTLVARGDDGLSRAEKETFDLVLTDLKLPGISGLELVARLHAAKPRLPIILMTAHGTTETAIEATKLGACEYLTKPFEADALLALAESAIASSRLMSEVVTLGETRVDGGSALIGNSPAMQALYKEIGRVAATTAPVLIRGATGTGKELVARAIYLHSHRARAPFIAVNCAAIPQALVESELFGHERGAFTGAHGRRIGRFEQAHRGTLFLDEVGDLPLESQAKLLRVVQDRSLQRLGGQETIPVDVRILAATHRDLEAAIQEGEFREDLFFRLSVVTLNVPALTERKGDIPELVRHFIRRYAPELGIKEPSIQSEALAFLQQQPWPGNVRELENVVRQALLAARPFPVSLEHVRQALGRRRAPGTAGAITHSEYVRELLARAERGEVTDAYWQMIADLETELVNQAMHLAGGNQSRAARWLGVTRLKLREKLAELNTRITQPERRESTSQQTSPDRSPGSKSAE